MISLKKCKNYKFSYEELYMNGSFIRLDDSWIGKTVLYGNQIINKPKHCKTCNCINYQLELIPATITAIHISNSILYPSRVSLHLSKEILSYGVKVSELSYVPEACWKCHAAYSWIHPDCK